MLKPEVPAGTEIFDRDQPRRQWHCMGIVADEYHVMIRVQMASSGWNWVLERRLIESPQSSALRESACVSSPLMHCFVSPQLGDRILFFLPFCPSASQPLISCITLVALSSILDYARGLRTDVGGRMGHGT